MYHFDKCSLRTLHRTLGKFNLHPNKPDDGTLGQFLHRLEVSLCCKNLDRYYISVPDERLCQSCTSMAHKDRNLSHRGVARALMLGGSETINFADLFLPTSMFAISRVAASDFKFWDNFLKAKFCFTK